MSLFVLPKGVKNLAANGKPYGQLTPAYIIEIRPGAGALWRCRCTCGETRDVRARQLIAGHVTRCKLCAKYRREQQLRRAWREAYEAGRFRPGRATEVERGWQEHRPAMTDVQRREFEDMIERRRRRGIATTVRLQSEIVDAVMRAA
ncbi:MAG TPA: hypothetical protein VF525_08070 [Pyrinomonadaceae bacterium]|jgi:hypothetical protein